MFIGNDGGGILITAHGIIRIPPWNPDVLAQFKALGALTRLSVGLDRKTNETVIDDNLTILTKAVETLVEKAGGQKPESILYYDADDGFVCGNGIHPFPWPRHQLLEPNVREDLNLATGKRTAAELQGTH
ncbi:MAG TPA: hypothetical protein VGQ93_08380 [Lysobacter sp.]|nr:hypothetical protein [Lysobacter sp.]